MWQDKTMKRYLLKELMKDRGFSNASLAKAIGISPAALSRKVNGHNAFFLDEWLKLKDLLEISEELERDLLT